MSVNKFNPTKHIPYIPNPYGCHNSKLLPNDLTLTCSQCGNQQTYSTKYSYRRAMGIGSDQTQVNKGLCGKCSRAEKRIPHGPRSKEWVEQNRLLRIRELGFNSIEEYEDNIFHMGKKSKYNERVDDMSRTNLKRDRPDLYSLWESYKYDGTDMEQYTIDHIKSKAECWKDRLSIKEASHISNLQVITMRENILKENPTASF